METEAPQFVLYFRNGCHLCEDMEQHLHELLEPESFSLRRVDIDEDPELFEQFNVRVPVLALDGNELCEHFLDLEVVRGALAGYNSRIPVNALPSL